MKIEIGGGVRAMALWSAVGACAFAVLSADVCSAQTRGGAVVQLPPFVDPGELAPMRSSGEEALPQDRHRSQYPNPKYDRRVPAPVEGEAVAVEELPPLNGSVDPRRSKKTDNGPGDDGRFEIREGTKARSKEVRRDSLSPLSDRRTAAANGFQNLADAEMRGLIAGLRIPPGSAALQELLIGVLANGGQDIDVNSDASALRFAMLFKAGQLQEIEAIVRTVPENKRSVIAQTFFGLSLLARSGPQAACSAMRNAQPSEAELKPQLLGQIYLFKAYCEAHGGRYDRALENLELAGEQGVATYVGFAVVRALRSEIALELQRPERLSLQDYAFIRLSKWRGLEKSVATAEPAALFAMVSDEKLNRRVLMLAAERAAQLYVVGSDVLGAAYAKLRFLPEELDVPLETDLPGVLRRGLLYQAIRKASNRNTKIRLISALLETARTAKLYNAVAHLLGEEIAELPIEPQYYGFAETAIDALMAAYEFDRAAEWARASQGGVDGEGSDFGHWLALAEISSGEIKTPRKISLEAAAELARKGGYGADVLHRLVTVLDALEYRVPAVLWDLSGKFPQPNRGYLPPDGILSQMKDAPGGRGAAYGNEASGQVKTALLALKALGADGPQSAHVIALGDSIRALKNSGLESQARLVGFEALYSIWPRQAGH